MFKWTRWGGGGCDWQVNIFGKSVNEKHKFSWKQPAKQHVTIKLFWLWIWGPVVSTFFCSSVWKVFTSPDLSSISGKLSLWTMRDTGCLVVVDPVCYLHVASFSSLLQEFLSALFHFQVRPLYQSIQVPYCDSWLCVSASSGVEECVGSREKEAFLHSAVLGSLKSPFQPPAHLLLIHGFPRLYLVLSFSRSYYKSYWEVVQAPKVQIHPGLGLLCVQHFSACEQQLEEAEKRMTVYILSFFYELNCERALPWGRKQEHTSTAPPLPPPAHILRWIVGIEVPTLTKSDSLSIQHVFIIDPLPVVACAFNGFAMKLSVSFTGSIDWHAESGSAKSSTSSQPCVDPKDIIATGAFKQGLSYMPLAWWSE